MQRLLESQDECCPICFNELRLDQAWQCATCRKSCHNFCYDKKCFYQKDDSCPFCRSKPETSVTVSMELDENSNSSVVSSLSNEELRVRGSSSLNARLCFFVVSLVGFNIFYLRYVLANCD